MNGAALSGDVALLGASGHARSVADVLNRIGREVKLVIAPDADPSWPHVFHGDEEGLAKAQSLGLQVVLGVGANDRRAQLAVLAAQFEVATPCVVAATATCATSAEVGGATVVFEHAHVGPSVL